MTRKPYTPKLGSISSGTMRPEDLIPAFADELAQCIKHDPLAYQEHAKLISDTTESLEEYDSIEADDILDELIHALNEFAPPYGYFGSHPDDGADYGYWLYPHFDNDFEGLKVSDTSEVPADYSGEVLHVNDHGNCTLYYANNGKLTEVWAVV